MQGGPGNAGLGSDLAEAAAAALEQPCVLDLAGGVSERAADLPSGGLGHSAGVGRRDLSQRLGVLLAGDPFDNRAYSKPHRSGTFTELLIVDEARPAVSRAGHPWPYRSPVMRGTDH